MSTRNSMLLFATAALSVLPLTAASPARLAHVLKNRQIESYNGCSDPQKAKLQQDFADAAAIANYAVGTLTTDKNAYVHLL